MRIAKGRLSRCSTLLAGLWLVVNTSCAKMILVSQADHRKIDPLKGETYRLTTTSGLVYEFKRCATTDSLLVILEIKSFGRNPSIQKTSAAEAPIAVPWDEIATVERIKTDYYMSILAVAVFGALAYAFIVFPGYDFY
jgi:transglutaminase/protease-like cytokinesis protein 3